MVLMRTRGIPRNRNAGYQIMPPRKSSCVFMMYTTNQSNISLVQMHIFHYASAPTIQRHRHVTIKHLNSSSDDITHFASGPPSAFSHVPKTTGDSNCYYYATLTGGARDTLRSKIEFDCICFKMYAGTGGVEWKLDFLDVQHLIFAIEKFLC